LKGTQSLLPQLLNPSPTQFVVYKPLPHAGLSGNSVQETAPIRVPPLAVESQLSARQSLQTGTLVVSITSFPFLPTPLSGHIHG
jgi:hypothetical protein